MELKKSDFYFELPEELIAQDPLTDRSSSRLLVLDRQTGKTAHRTFKELPEFLRAGDCLVLNDTKVIPARLLGVREDTGAGVELLLLKRKEKDVWETLVRPGKKCRPGARLSFGDGIVRGEITEVVEEGNRLVRFFYDGVFEEVLDRLGEMPLPPYIHKKLQDKSRYQTVYAKYDGSAAAPTAGLHFTKEMLLEIERKGVRIAYVTLHVGLGTFRPVKEENILEHHMHEEWYRVSEETATAVNETKAAGGRVFCVGTTSCRTLESAANRAGGAAAEHLTPSLTQSARAEGAVEARKTAERKTVAEGAARKAATESVCGRLTACEGSTDIFIYPGYRFQVMDGLITNFHLPESTLVMLVSAFAGRENVLRAYHEAIAEKYRFFSFGDAMLIV